MPAHEEKFGLERLYELCEIAFEEVKPYRIARVIARPFAGEKNGAFVRTKNRHDYALNPPAPTILDKAKAAGLQVTAIGKISDIYAGSGVTRKVLASGLEELWNKTLEEVQNQKGDGIVFTNFVDFDMMWGHRRDVKGYAEGLMYFDRRLPELEPLLGEDDVVFITADHGCDPTYPGSDHTRECVPVLMFGRKVQAQNIGRRKTYADIAETIAAKFGWSRSESARRSDTDKERKRGADGRQQRSGGAQQEHGGGFGEGLPDVGARRQRGCEATKSARLGKKANNTWRAEKLCYIRLL